MRARRSKEDWQELIQRQADSGFSAQQFCHDNDVCPKYFIIRKKQLGRQSAFVPISQSRRGAPDIPAGALTPASIAFQYGRCCLRFETMPDSAWLAQLVRALA
ncbi:MAG: hypothetical protein Q7T74_02300 [Candidatus Saccharibacteria bacterium]|nr:hypothetical protein [Candidatus Saccharibacteria bacterium]